MDQLRQLDTKRINRQARPTTPGCDRYRAIPHRRAGSVLRPGQCPSEPPAYASPPGVPPTDHGCCPRPSPPFQGPNPHDPQRPAMDPARAWRQIRYRNRQRSGIESRRQPRSDARALYSESLVITPSAMPRAASPLRKGGKSTAGASGAVAARMLSRCSSSEAE